MRDAGFAIWPPWLLDFRVDARDLDCDGCGEPSRRVMRADGPRGCALCAKCHRAYRRMEFALREFCAACGVPFGSTTQEGKLLLILPCGGCEVPTYCCTLHLRAHRCDTGRTEIVGRLSA